MNSISSMNDLLIRAAAFGLLLLAAPAIAEEADKVQELQCVIDAQQRQLEAQQRQLEAQMQMLMQLQSEVEGLAKSADKERATPPEGGAPTQQPPVSAKAQSQADEKSTLSSTPTIESPQPAPPKKTGVAEADRFDSESPTGELCSKVVYG